MKFVEDEESANTKMGIITRTSKSVANERFRLMSESMFRQLELNESGPSSSSAAWILYCGLFAVTVA